MPLITIPGQESTTALELFFRKVYRLANLRVQNLCKEIGISEGIMAKVSFEFFNSFFVTKLRFGMCLSKSF